ncbi:CHRD domain-containing protein [Dongia soli]|uniref:CHRD domain-containing protein n=1 Tax=Dongia soli TaxID=600628 RepID=A0ABU5EDQ1_9PROT|nr:CHRD domain-containing protein [Dongia soli]MDY0883578.1 CHRD domain-containing protein [Dongia soli]
MFRSALGLTAFVTLLMPAAAGAETVTYHATLSSAAEVPPNKTAGTGTATAMIDTDLKMLSYKVEYTGLSGPATAGHFHGPAAVGKNAAVLIPIMAPLGSPINGMAKLTDAEIADFAAGSVYVNIHTEKNPGGEIRGQMSK